MAATWEQLATARQKQIEKRRALDEQGLVIEFEVLPDGDNDPKQKH